MVATLAENLTQTLNWRYATKRFDPSKKIPADQWASLAESLRMAPSSFGLQPWRFLLVKNPETLKALRAAAWDQPQVVECSHFVVLAAQNQVGPQDVSKLIAASAAARGTSPENLKGYEDMMNGFLKQLPEHKQWTSRQCYIALGFLMLAAAQMQIDSCPMEGFDPAQFDKLLGLESTPYRSVVCCALGYRSKEDKISTKVRYPSKDVLFTLE